MTTKRTPKAGHDFGHGDPARPRSYQIKAFDFTSKNDGTKTPGYADNPMCDPSEINEEASSDLDKLHDMLTRIGITDDEIKGGLSLTQKGYHKVAAALGTTVESVQSLVNSLVKMLNGEHSEPILSEKTVTIAPQKMSMMDEINSNVGTMEFPWKIGNRKGLATAAYKSDGEKFYIKISNVYEDGDLVNLPEDEKRAIRKQAIAFIGNE
jgi:hypothetical protein